MGSSGSGNFSDYSNNNPVTGAQGGTSGIDDCKKAFSAKLEEVDRCEYYIKYSTLPPIGTVVKLDMGTRLEVRTSKSELIGYLPTSFNYLAKCLKEGFRYSGSVINIRAKPTLVVQIDMAP